ncbi:MAG TPA: helix-turn-helix transcriptional regulator [Hanamia sp.]|nr:helix-turn-helix transcriptional regulator [Hanamia sp.]
MNDKIKSARQQLGMFFKERREEMGHKEEYLAKQLDITVNTVKGIETGRFAWDIDLHLRICQALEIKPYFSATQPPDQEDYKLRKEDDPERYHGFYCADNLLLYPGEVAIIKLTHPRLFVRFNYAVSFFSSFEDWVANQTDLQWLDEDDKPNTDEEIEEILTDCWNFLALQEREEDRLADEREDENL